MTHKPKLADLSVFNKIRLYLWMGIPWTWAVAVMLLSLLAFLATAWLGSDDLMFSMADLHNMAEDTWNEFEEDLAHAIDTLARKETL